MKKLLAAIGLLVVLAGCQSTDAPESQINIAVPHGNTSYALTWMMTNGADLEGADLNFEIMPNAEALAARVLEGVDLAIVPVNMAASLYNKDAGYLVAGVATWGNLFVLSANDEINGWDDLDGNLVHAFGRGLVPGAAFSYLLERNEAAADVEYLSTPGEVAQAMIGGIADVALLADEKVTQVLEQTDARIILDLNAEWGGEGYPQGVIIVSEALAQQDPELVRELLAEMALSMDWANENPAELGILASRLDEAADAKLIEASIERLHIRFQSSAEAQTQIIGFLEALYGMNPELVGGQVPGDALFY